MIEVVGGVYEERCLRPEWHHLYGSGGRAAAALAARTSVILHTYVDDAWRRNLAALAGGFGYTLRASACPKTVLFSYVHPLSVPVIHPAPPIKPMPPLMCQAEVVLRFGMMESDGKVDGSRVVYDPQSATDPAFFRKNGSTAKHLAVVANGYEVRLLTGELDPLAGARVIMAADQAEVVVVKRGSQGALVVTQSSQTAVPAYQAEQVFSIGSGDIFAAAFAYFWGVQKLSPHESADLASRATATYCETQSLEIQEQSVLCAAAREPVTLKPGRAYLAGPFFTLAQRWLIEEARLHLMTSGLDVFSPLHDVGPGTAEIVAPADIAGLRSCDRVLALADGADTGTLFEIGYARALGLPVVALSECLSAEQLKMLVGSGCDVTPDFATAIYKTAWLQ